MSRKEKSLRLIYNLEIDFIAVLMDLRILERNTLFTESADIPIRQCKPVHRMIRGFMKVYIKRYEKKPDNDVTFYVFAISAPLKALTILYEVNEIRMDDPVPFLKKTVGGKNIFGIIIPCNMFQRSVFSVLGIFAF